MYLYAPIFNPHCMSREQQNDLPFRKENYVIMGIGLAALILGFMLMAGGGSDDPEVYSDEIFSFRRWTLSPLVILAGFGAVLYGILKKPKLED